MSERSIVTVATICDSIAAGMRERGVRVSSAHVATICSQFLESAMMGPPLTPEHDRAVLQVVECLDAVTD